MKLLAARCRRLAFLLAGASLLAACGTVPASPTGAIIWKMDNLQSIGGHEPAVQGSPKVTAAGTGSALAFNGVNDGLILPVVPVAGMKAFTIEVLFFPQSGGSTEQRFLHAEDTAMNRLTMETRLTPDGKWTFDTFLLSGASRLSIYDATKLHPADHWYWVALRYDGATMTSFINGLKEGEGAVVFPAMKDTGKISIGVRQNLVGWFKGLIREVRFTPEALPESALQRVP